jgi:Protein of unknown function (DUF1493)
MMHIKFTQIQKKNMSESSIKADNFTLLRTFISEQTGHNTEKILQESRINFDFKIDGDDADDFMQAYSKEFNVDLSEFDFEKYFNTEGTDPIIGFFIWLFRSNRTPKSALYVKDLLLAVDTKKWVKTS